MAELNPRDRLQPFLLDRLTDDTPGAVKESREKGVMSPQQLKVALLRDLAWLLNTPAPTVGEGLTEFPNVAASVLNFGVADLTGQTASGVGATALEREVLRAIQNFEPRLEKRSVTVHMLTEQDGATPNTLALEIRGQVIANPLPESLYLKTSVDLETGQIDVKDRPNG
jgi:type VI secretion system protein ImpF